jgi:hypothetical protein
MSRSTSLRALSVVEAVILLLKLRKLVLLFKLSALCLLLGAGWLMIVPFTCGALPLDSCRDIEGEIRVRSTLVCKELLKDFGRSGCGVTLPESEASVGGDEGLSSSSSGRSNGN